MGSTGAPARVGSATGDLDHRSAIHDVVVSFYREVVVDDLLAPVFGEVAETDWPTHIPRLIDYWCRVLLGEPGYAGALLASHRHVHDIEAFRIDHFDRWYELWVRSIDARARGPYADQAKVHAARLAATLARRLLGVAWSPSDPTGEADRPLHEPAAARPA